MGENKNSSFKMIEICSPKERDVPGIQQVVYRAWLATFPNDEYGITKDDIEDRFKDEFTDEARAKRWENIQRESNGRMFLAKVAAEVVGVMVVARLPEGNSLRYVYILHEFQGQGIGRRLWDEARRYLDPKKSSFVQVATYNTGAINFYKKLGFRDNGRRFEEERFRMKSGANMPHMEMERASDES